MKRMRKLAGLLLAMAMVLSMAMTALAAEPTTHTITVPDNGHTYEVYQIFKGDLFEATLSNVVWGQNGTGTTDAKVDKAILDELAGLVATAAPYQDELNVITKYVDLDSTPVATLGKDVNKSATVPTGYYLIKDKDNTVPTGESYTTFVVKLVANITLEPKDEVPTVEKKVKDTNDTTGAITNWQDSADYHIGDVMEFQLKGIVAADFAEYEVYYFAFHDTEDKGLTFNEGSVKVYVDGNLITSGYQVVVDPEDGHTFDVVFEDLKQVTSVKADSVITVEYTSTLNEDAIIGSNGNKNKVYLEFSNNPSDEQGGLPHGTTPEDTVIIFTFKTIVNKIDPEGNALTGAEFTLSQKLADGTWKEIAVVKNDEGTTFTFKGLDDGIYKLEETKSPAGFNKIDTIYFEITAEHDVLSDSPALTELKAIQRANEAGAELESGKVTFKPTISVPDGSIIAGVINQRGTVLPETGGIGTTLFYVVGAILVVGAAVMLVTKKRMGNV